MGQQDALVCRNPRADLEGPPRPPLASSSQALSSACSARHILMALLDAQPENWAMDCGPPTNPAAPFQEWCP